MRLKTQTVFVLIAIVVAAQACKTSDSDGQAKPASYAQTKADEQQKVKDSPSHTHIIVGNVGFMTPESVLYDARSDQYLVSNINGKPTDKDDNGFISKLSPDGKVVELKWIDGSSAEVELNAPKGMTLAEDTLYVADLDKVRLFDRKSGKAKGSIKLEGATFVNDVIAAADGTVYVTDSGLNADFSASGSDAIWKISVGKASVLIKNTGLGKPNGICMDKDSLVIVNMGNDIYKVSLTGEKQASHKVPAGSLDGVNRLDDGSFILSSWQGKQVFHLGADGIFKAVVSEVQAPADIGWDSKRHAVLIPLFMDDQVIIQTLAL